MVERRIDQGVVEKRIDEFVGWLIDLLQVETCSLSN